MRALLAVALLAGATLAHAQTKKELLAKLLQLQQPAVEALAREIATRPASQMLQAAGQALGQLPPDKREAAARTLEADARRYADEAVPLAREQALKLVASTFGAGLDEKFSEEELRQLIAWHESPVIRKYQQVAPELQKGFTDKLVAAAGPALDPKLSALQEKMARTLGAPAPAASAPARAASGAARPAGK